MNKYIKIAAFYFGTMTLSGCNDNYLDLFPETQVTKENYFNSQSDLEMYIYNLYNFPGSELYESDATTDNASTTGNKEIKNIMQGNATAVNITTGWNWDRLRNINFFLENFDKAKLSEAQLNHYEGLARYFRARFYVDKVQRFSDVPWVDQVITPDNEALLFGKRDSRAFVVDKIMEDFEFAAEHVNATSGKGSVNKWVVLLEFSRFALYEGTFRKYNNELELQNTADGFITKASSLSEQIMTNGGFEIHNTGKPNEDYASLFFSQGLEPNKEVILGRFYAHNILNASSWPGMFGNYEYYPLRDLLQSYLMKDGSFYTSRSGYEQFSFVQEFENRDPRLAQTYAYPGWELIYNSTYSQGVGLYVQQLAKNFSGYHQIKGFLNTTSLEARNNMDIPVYRYAEVLLNFAEAKAELGTLTQGDLDKSINVLRKRVGMPNLELSQAIDPLLVQRYPLVDGSQRSLVLEIRRERRVELAFEGYRFQDLMRWKAGKLLEKKPEGIYFSGLGQHDVTGDGVPDIVLLRHDESIPETRESNSLGRVFQYYITGTFGQNVSVFLANGSSGSVQVIENPGTFEEPKHYYRPIPQQEVFLNDNLKQIFGW